MRLTALFIGWVCIVASIPAPPTRATRAGMPSGKSKLLKHDRIRLVEAVAQKKPSVSLVLAARRGMNAQLASEIQALQGTVQYRDDDVDYLRVELPTKQVLKLSYSPALESINLTGKVDYLTYPNEESARSRATGPTEIRPPNRDTPPINPYLPSGAMGAPQFISAHPTFDGRGVVVAIVDSNIDLLLPELQSAKALDGQTVPKFADVVAAPRNAIVPFTDDSHLSGYMKVDMPTEITTSETRFSFQNRAYIAPVNGKYRIGTLNERLTGASGDLNRDGNPDGSSSLFDLLWNQSSNTVWVDTNQNFNFADEKPMVDYHVRHDIGVFGKDDPKTPVRETVGFTIQTDSRHQSVFVIPGYGSHGTGVTGAAFGARFFGGKLDGVAPGAQIMSVPSGRGGSITATAIEGVITAMKDPRVDLVSLEFGNFIPQNDGRATFSLICNRLIQKYGKLIFASAGNGTDALNGTISPADAEEVIAVGSYLSRETGKVNYGVDVRDDDNMNGYTSRGPTQEGVLKPNLLAPATTLSTRPGFLQGDNSFKSYSLPPGYQVYSGTSTSAPFAAAGAALLISAAKQSGVKYDARRLRSALMSSARFLPKYGPEIQGAGLLQVPAAWEALKNAPEPIEIISRGSVKTVHAENLRVSNQGVGIFEREGWTAGQSNHRTLSLTRISGSPGPMKFALRWTGNDGTFAGPPDVVLPLNTPVDVQVAISPKTSGVHSALLNLVSPDGVVVHQLANTVVAAEQLDAHNGFTITRSGEAEWLHSQSYFVHVPAGTPALKVDVRIAEGSVMPSLTRPNGRFYYALAQDQFPVRYTRHQNAGAWSRVVPNPDPGVWQITMDNCEIIDRSILAGSASFTVSAALLGITVESGQTRGDLAPDFSQRAELRFTNSHASFVSEIANLGLASVFAGAVTFAGSEPIEYELEVAPGTTRVGASIADPGVARADVDLYLFDCTAGECVLRDFSTGTGASEQVAVDSPPAGKWKIVIDLFSANDRRNSIRYKDYLLHPAYGRIDVQNDRSPLAHGAAVTVPLSVKIGAVPVAPRTLEAMLPVIVRPGPNSDSQKRPDALDLYFPDQVIVGAATIKLQLAAFHSTRK